MNVTVCNCPFCVWREETETGNKKKIRNGNKNENRKIPTRIVVERIYLGGQSMEDAFRKINEETVRKNIEEIVGKTV